MLRSASAVEDANRSCDLRCKPFAAVCRRDVAWPEGGLSSGTDRVVPHDAVIDEAMPVRRGSVPWLLVVVAVTAIAVFVALTIAVTGSSSLAS